MIRGSHIDGQRDLVFVPLGINYDRVLEDRTLLQSAEGKRPGRLRAMRNTLAFVLRNLMLLVRSEWHRFGYACVNFGAPLSMREYCRTRGIDFQRLAGEARKQAMARLGAELMAAVGRMVPVVPVALVSTVLLRHPRSALSELDIKAQVGRVLHELQAAGAHVYVPRSDLDYALSVGLRMLRLRRLVEERDGLLCARSGELPMLRYYANSIAHLLAPLDEKISLQ
jgi:glycerol-3-phosphate O-acyltransferase